MFNVAHHEQQEMPYLISSDKYLQKEFFPENVLIIRRTNYATQSMNYFVDPIITPHDWSAKNWDAGSSSNYNDFVEKIGGLIHPSDVQKVYQLYQKIEGNEIEEWSVDVSLHTNRKGQEWIKVRDKGVIREVNGNKIATGWAKPVNSSIEEIKNVNPCALCPHKDRCNQDKERGLKPVPEAVPIKNANLKDGCLNLKL